MLISIIAILILSVVFIIILNKVMKIKLVKGIIIVSLVLLLPLICKIGIKYYNYKNDVIKEIQISEDIEAPIPDFSFSYKKGNIE